MSTSGGIIVDGVGLQDLIADRKSCFCSKDSRSCDFLIDQPKYSMIDFATHIAMQNDNQVAEIRIKGTKNGLSD